MPFTAAHPLAALPLTRIRRVRLDATCLVIGSMSPDFEYFVRARLVGKIGHSLPGLVTWCLPATLVAAVLFHAIVKWPAVLVAPAPIGRRLAPLAARPWIAKLDAWSVPMLVVSALLGAATHLFWDGITHGSGWGPSHFAFLCAPHRLPFVGAIATYRILQHLSTAVGLVWLSVVVRRRLIAEAPVADVPVGRALPRLVTALVLAIALALGIANLVRISDRFLPDVVCTLIGAGLAAAIVAGLLLWIPARAWRLRVVAPPGGA